MGAVASFFVLSAFVWILGFALTPLGPAGKFITGVLRVGLGIWISYAFFNMLATKLGARGTCPQGYRSGWPPLSFPPGRNYQRDPVTGLRRDEP